MLTAIAMKTYAIVYLLSSGLIALGLNIGYFIFDYHRKTGGLRSKQFWTSISILTAILAVITVIAVSLPPRIIFKEDLSKMEGITMIIGCFIGVAAGLFISTSVFRRQKRTGLLTINRNEMICAGIIAASFGTVLNVITTLNT